MNKTQFALALLFAATLTACQKKAPVEADASAPATTSATPTPVIAPDAAAKDQTPEELERAMKQGKLDYATMEDGYINDARGQWAQSAKATSTFGDDNGRTPSESSLAINVVGSPDGKSWTNNHQDMGFDSVEVTYVKPLSATSVRIVCNNQAVKSISKLELQDANGSWNTVWSGLSDVQTDERGPRNWFVKTFPKTAHQVKAVKVTFANTVEAGYKEVDAIQLIGE